jgi:hypothetical protein
MYFSDSWSFLLELEGDSPVLDGKGLVPVDLSEEDDWGDIEPYRDAASGLLGCKVGKHDKEGDEVREVVRVWEYKEDKPFNGKFAFFEPVTLPKFVGRLLDAGLFFGQDEEEVRELKRKYGL